MRLWLSGNALVILQSLIDTQNLHFFYSWAPKLYVRPFDFLSVKQIFVKNFKQLYIAGNEILTHPLC